MQILPESTGVTGETNDSAVSDGVHVRVRRLEQMLGRICRRRSMAEERRSDGRRSGGGAVALNTGGVDAPPPASHLPFFPLRDLEYSREELSRMMKRCRHKEREAFEE